MGRDKKNDPVRVHARTIRIGIDLMESPIKVRKESIPSMLLRSSGWVF